ncbi:hypothetical protein P3T76_014958 [Phytophthora citrophthora]|uniref:Uncharacterized protein n=1 Tax=Phytophthora citrophthora TaxID=4793 RepID=A0AAD9G0R0_9STRA|nr:hypothetical protein P3T76_014958 [Phytophthora citrophthora]
MESVSTVPEETEMKEQLSKIEIRRLKDRIRRRRTILRRKCELEALNWEIQELSKQVESLRSKGGADTPTLAWKATASRQIRALQRLADERRNLRQEVRKQAVLIHDMSNVLHNKLQESVESNSPRLEQSKSPLIQQYVRELPGIYKQTASVFQMCTMNSSHHSSIIQTTRETQDGTEFFQSCGRVLMPFGYHQTRSFLWRLAVLAYRHENRKIYSVGDPENTLAVRFRVKGSYADNKTASMTVHYAMRRYEEADRTVLVWRSLTEGEGVFWGMHMDETGWCIVRASPTDASTVVETCSRLVPMHLSSDRNLTDQFTAVVLKAAEQRLLLESKTARRREVCNVNHATRKALINRQLKRRLVPEATQLWLKTAIAGKSTLISDLIALIELQLRTASWITVQSSGLYDNVFLQPTDELLYAMYSHELDQVYAQTDTVFSYCGMDLKEETSSFQHTALMTNGDTVSMQFGRKQ